MQALYGTQGVSPGEQQVRKLSLLVSKTTHFILESAAYPCRHNGTVCRGTVSIWLLNWTSSMTFYLPANTRQKEAEDAVMKEIQVGYATNPCLV